METSLATCRHGIMGFRRRASNVVYATFSNGVGFSYMEPAGTNHYTYDACSKKMVKEITPLVRTKISH
jgi:hypothetical protein